MNTPGIEFDERVRRAMDKWPDVPDCFDWLGLDVRGRWLIRGEVITHPTTVEYLARNYSHDAQGRWFVQNGPQRVFCELEYTPWVYFLQPDLSLLSHTKAAAGEINRIIVDDAGDLLIDARLGPGVLYDRDLGQLVAALDVPVNDGRSIEELLSFTAHDSQTPSRVLMANDEIPIESLDRQDVAAHFGYQSRPRPRATDSAQSIQVPE